MADPLATTLKNLSGNLPNVGFMGRDQTVSPEFQGFQARRNSDKTLELLDRRDRIESLKQRAKSRVEGAQAMGQIADLDPTSETYREDVAGVLARNPNAFLDEAASKFIDLGLQTADIHERDRQIEAQRDDRRRYAKFSSRLQSSIEEKRFERKAQNDLNSAILELSPAGQEKALAHLQENPEDIFRAVMLGKRFDEDMETADELEADGVDPEIVDAYRRGELDRKGLVAYLGEEARAEKNVTEVDRKIDALLSMNRDYNRLLSAEVGDEADLTQRIHDNLQQISQLMGLSEQTVEEDNSARGALGFGKRQSPAPAKRPAKPAPTSRSTPAEKNKPSSSQVDQLLGNLKKNGK